MNIYQVGYYSYEESPKFLLKSEKLYTKKQFDDLVSDCYKKAYLNIRKDFESDDNIDHMLSQVEDFLEEVIKILKNEFGFETFNPVCNFMPFGWASVTDYKDWKDDIKSDTQLKLIRDKINCL